MALVNLQELRVWADVFIARCFGLDLDVILIITGPCVDIFKDVRNKKLNSST